tara:strand:- start:4037 stop:8407 length:4371 start_codon:yes stop_codon:yes gene_type:complete
MGNLFPGAFKEQLQDFLDSFPDAIPQAAGLCACASPEQVEEFCDLRSQILSGRATAEQITQICVPSNDLSDIANALQGGIPEAALPPLFSDPGCDNGVLPIEPAESVSVATAGLSGDLEALKIEFAYDMIGNGPWESKWGLMNMILSDTMGKPLTAHYRKSANNRKYVDFYMDQDEDALMDELDASSDLPRRFSPENAFNAIFPNPPKLGKQEGAFPTKIADWLQDYMQDKLTVNFSSSNEFMGATQTTASFAQAGVRTIGSGVNLLRLDSETLGYDTKVEVDSEAKELLFTQQARKATPDLTLSFQDNCKGLQADKTGTSGAEYTTRDEMVYDEEGVWTGEYVDVDAVDIGSSEWFYDTGAAYSKAFDLELYLSDLVSDDGTLSGARNRGSFAGLDQAITSLDDGHRHTYILNDGDNGETSWADGHIHLIENGVVEEVCEEDGKCHTHTLLEASIKKGAKNKNQPRDTSRIRILEKSNVTGVTWTKPAACVPVIRLKILGKEIVLFDDLQNALIPKNSAITIEEATDVDSFLGWLGTWGGDRTLMTFPTILMQDTKYEFLSVDNTLDGINFDNYPKFLSTFSGYQDSAPQIVLLEEILKNNGYDVSDLSSEYDDIMNDLTQLITAEVAYNDSAFEYGATFDELNTQDVEYVIEEAIAGVNSIGQALTYPAGSNYYDVRLKVPLLDPLIFIFKTGVRPLLPRDQIMGISRMQYDDNVTAAASLAEGSTPPPPTNRVFYLDPLTYGGSYVNPPLYVSPPATTGWLGFVEVMFPEMSPCKPYTTDLIDFKDIQDKINNAYPNIPEDERLRDDPDCAVELPYNRILNRADVAGLEGLISAAIRIYVSANFVKSMATFTKFNPSFPEVFSSLYAQYIVEDIEAGFKDAQKGFWEFFNPFKDSKFWYGFLEQTVQLYGRKVDDGSITDPPEDVLDAMARLNDMQQAYAYPDQAELDEEKGEMAGLFESLKKYREDKNYEAIQKTEEDAKLIFKELVIEELNFMGAKLIENLKIVGMSPDIYDLDNYLLQYLSAGGYTLTLDEELVRTYVDLPTEGEEHYSGGGEFAASDGSEYIGYFHVTADDEGHPVYMAGEFHSEESHDTLTPFANKIEVNVGDIAELGDVDTSEKVALTYGTTKTDTAGLDVIKPFIIEKYMRINGGAPQVPGDSSSGAIGEIMSNASEVNISDAYPGSLDLVTDTNGQVVGLSGELGVRYGLRFSLNISGGPYMLTEVEVDSLDLKIDQVDPFARDSMLLLCLINKLKEDDRFRMVAHYIFPLSKLTATTAIYNAEAFLPSIGEKVVPLGQVNSDQLNSKPGMNVSFTLTKDEGNTDVVEEEDFAAATGYRAIPGGIDGWANKVDRDPASWANPLAINGIMEFDSWDQVLLRNSKSKIKRMFKNYYKSRDLDDTEDEPSDSQGVIITNQLKEKFVPRPGKGLLPFWKRRMLRTNPFNANGELCEEKD